jgi:ferredoxin-type protein NapF
LADVDHRRRAFLTGRLASSSSEGEARARIGSACLARRGVACMSCRDACPEDAIRFTLARGGALPAVEPGRCTGCGECALVCPAAAIQVPEPHA